MSIATHIIDVTGGTVHTVDSLLAAAVPTGASIVAAINTQLGSTTWQGGGSGTPAWGAIVGTLSDQTDLQTALNGKAATDHDHMLEDLTDLDVTADMVAFSRGLRPGLYDDLDDPPPGTIIESVNDGHLYWVHRDGSVHLLCDTGGYGGGTWGSITGTLADQTDLQAALNAKQPLDAELTALAGLTSAANKLPYFTGSGAASLTDLTAVARTFLAQPDAASQRSSMSAQALNVNLSAISGLSSAADTAIYFTGSGTASLFTVTLQARNLLDDPTASAMRGTLGLVIGTNVQAQNATLQSIAGLSTAADTSVYFTGAGTAAVYTLTTAARAILELSSYDAMLSLLAGGVAATGSGGLVRATSPALAGTPTTPTAAVGTATTQVASTEFVRNGVASAMTPGLRSTRYYACYAAPAVTTFTLIANRLYYFPFYNPAQNTWTRIGINVTTGAAGNARLGVYNNVNGIPSGAPLLDAGTVDVSTTGEKEVVISLALAPGWYWLAVVSDVTPTLTAEQINGATLLCNVGSITGAGAAVVYIYQSHTYAALPTPSGIVALAATNPPRIWMRFP